VSTVSEGRFQWKGLHILFKLLRIENTVDLNR